MAKKLSLKYRNSHEAREDRIVNQQVQNQAILLKNSVFGVSNFNFFLSLLLIFFCMLAIFLSVTSSKLVCFGIYCLISLFVFSIAPFCHEA